MAQTKSKTEKTDQNDTPDVAPDAATEAAPDVVELLKAAATDVVDALPPSLAKPVRDNDRLFDDAVTAACADRDGGKYRLTGITDEAARKRFKRTINAAVKRLGRESDRVKYVYGDSGVYWTVYTVKPKGTKSNG